MVFNIDGTSCTFQENQQQKYLMKAAFSVNHCVG